MAFPLAPSLGDTHVEDQLAYIAADDGTGTIFWKREVADVLDEDDFVSDSATEAPTQQSTKAYVDNSVVTIDHLKSTAGVLNPEIPAHFVVGDVLRTASYFDGSDLGGTTYRVVAAGTGTDDGGSFIDVDVTRQLQAVFGEEIHVAQFGVVPDAVTDNTTAMQAAIDRAISSQTTGTRLVLPSGVIGITGLSIPETVHMVGAGGYLTVLRMLSNGVTGVTLRAHSRAQRRWDATYDPVVAESAVRFTGFLVQGQNGNGQTGIILEDQCDRVIFTDVRVMNCDQGLLIGEPYTGNNNVGTTRESEFYSCSVDNCGTSAGLPAMRIQAPPTLVAGDGTNQLYFYGLRTLYNYGPIIIAGGSSTETLRRMQFHGWMLHGRGDEDNLQFGDTLIIESVSGVEIYGLQGNGSKVGSALIRLRQGTGADTGFPRAIKIIGGLGPLPGDGIVVEDGQALDFDLATIGTSDADFVRVEAGSLTGDRPMRLSVLSASEGAAGAPIINIVDSERPQIHGYWDGKQRFAASTEAIDSGTGLASPPLELSGRYIQRLAADVTKVNNTDTTLATSTDPLLLPSLLPGVYEIQAVLVFDAPEGEDISAIFRADGGSLDWLSFNSAIPNWADTTPSIGSGRWAAANAPLLQSAGGEAGSPLPFIMNALVEVTGGSPQVGAFWAQRLAGATGSTLKQGSYIRALKFA